MCIRKLDDYLSCPSILSICEDDYLKQREEEFLRRIIVEEHLRHSLEFCQTMNQATSSSIVKRIDKRSPAAKKKGGRRGSSGRITSKVRSVLSRNTGRNSQKGLGAILLNKKKSFGAPGKFAAKGVKRKGGILRKVGKYAVVGLAGK